MEKKKNPLPEKKFSDSKRGKQRQIKIEENRQVGCIITDTIKIMAKSEQSSLLSSLFFFFFENSVKLKIKFSPTSTLFFSISHPPRSLPVSYIFLRCRFFFFPRNWFYSFRVLMLNLEINLKDFAI